MTRTFQRKTLSSAIAFLISAFALVAGVITPTHANAADANTASITLKAGEGTTLSGHTFKLYQLGTYDNIQSADGKLKTVDAYPKNEATGTLVSSALAGAKVTPQEGDNAISTLLRLSTTDDAKTLMAVAKSLSASLADETPTWTGTAEGASYTIQNLEQGYYLLVDSQGLPILISTKINNMDFPDHMLGETYIKSKVANIDKTVTTWDGKQVKNASATNGMPLDFTLKFTLPNALAAKSVTIDDKATGLKYNDDLKIVVNSGSAKGTDITSKATLTARDGQMPLIVLDSSVIKAYDSQQIVVTYSATATDLTRTTDAGNKVDYSVQYNDDFDEPDSHDDDDTVIKTYGVALKKVSAASGNPVVPNAGFKIYSKTLASWLSFDSDTSQWSKAKDEASATEFKSDKDGHIDFNALGGGQYTITETTVPDGFYKSYPSFDITITDDGHVTSTHDGTKWGSMITDVTNADESKTNPTVTVKNINSLTQLPQTGFGTPMFMAMVIVEVTLLGVAVTAFIKYRKA